MGLLKVVYTRFVSVLATRLLSVCLPLIFPTFLSKMDASNFTVLYHDVFTN